jgi:hypothetical protein
MIYLIASYANEYYPLAFVGLFSYALSALLYALFNTAAQQYKEFASHLKHSAPLTFNER